MSWNRTTDMMTKMSLKIWSVQTFCVIVIERVKIQKPKQPILFCRKTIQCYDNNFELSYENNC